MSPDLANLHLLRPWWLLLLAGVAAIVLLDRAGRRDERGWAKIVAPALRPWVMVTDGKAPRIRPGPAAALTLTVAALALAGPSWRREPSPFVTDQAPMMIALDMSRGGAADLPAAKRKIRDLVAARGDARTGLIAYAGTAHLVLPPANDPRLIATYLDALSPDVMPRDGRDAVAALSLSLGQLAASGRGGTAVIVTAALPTSQAEAFARAMAKSPHGVIVFSPAPVLEGALDGARGATIVAPTIDRTDIAMVLAAAERHYTAASRDDPTRRWHDEGPWFALPLLPLALLWARRGFLAAALLGLYLAGAPPARAADGDWFVRLWLTPDQRGRAAFDAGRYAEAAALFGDPMWRGAALYRSGDFPNAASAFATLDTAEAWFDRGNSQLMQAAGWHDALVSYDHALKLRPDFPAATANRALAQAFIDHENAEKAQRDDQNTGKPNLKSDGDVADQGPPQEPSTTPPQADTGGGLSNDQITALWMRRVGGTPADFMRLRFARQAETPAP